MTKYETLFNALFELLEEVQCAEADRPESCSCHINPPCSHCCYEPANEAMTAVDNFISDWDNKE